MKYLAKTKVSYFLSAKNFNLRLSSKFKIIIQIDNVPKLTFSLQFI